MQEYIEIQEREVNRYLEEIKEKTVSQAHDTRIKEGLDFFEIDKFDRSLSILDVGCRDGRQIEIIKNKGFVNIKGLELSKKGIDICLHKKLVVIKGDIHNFVVLDNLFDLIVVTHVIEHCYSVPEVIYRIRKGLKVHGLVFIEVPVNRNDVKGEWGHYINFKDSNNVFTYCDGFEIIKQQDSKNVARLVLRKI